jgi:hypothetical protein
VKFLVLDHGGEDVARFEHVRHALAALPALAHATHGSVFLCWQEGTNPGISRSDLPRGASFESRAATRYESARRGVVFNPCAR